MEEIEAGPSDTGEDHGKIQIAIAIFILFSTGSKMNLLSTRKD